MMKYSCLEVERRWLVNEERLPDLTKLPFKTLIDIYIDQSRLRLRKEVSNNEIKYKLCKKYGKLSDISERITNIYLTKEEYLLFSTLAGETITRKRYYYLHDNVLMSINTGIEIPTIIEAEFANEEEARAFSPPSFTTLDISNEVKYEIASLVKNTI